jgi:hypothetical protein
MIKENSDDASTNYTLISVSSKRRPITIPLYACLTEPCKPLTFTGRYNNPFDGLFDLRSSNKKNTLQSNRPSTRLLIEDKERVPVYTKSEFSAKSNLEFPLQNFTKIIIFYPEELERLYKSENFMDLVNFTDKIGLDCGKIFPKAKTFEDFIRELGLDLNDCKYPYLFTVSFIPQSYFLSKVYIGVQKILNKIEDLEQCQFVQFLKPIIISKEEIVNGYKLYDCKENLFDYDTFQRLKSLFNSPKKFSWKKWEKKLDNCLCTGWAKVDEFGESFMGEFWESHDPTIRSDAYNLTRKSNITKLHELPYSPKIKIWTTEYSCKLISHSVSHSVRYCNFICEWVKRKIEQLDKIDPIKKIKFQSEKIYFREFINPS